MGVPVRNSGKTDKTLLRAIEISRQNLLVENVHVNDSVPGSEKL
jgi:hypothetical protein